MVCGSCVQKLAYKLISHHPKLDFIRALELADRGVERHEQNKRIQIKPTSFSDPVDYTKPCTVGGSCGCYLYPTPCDDDAGCIHQTCGCSCPAPLANSHLESNTCSPYTYDDAGPGCTGSCQPYVVPPSWVCHYGWCECACDGTCSYHCNTGYVWNGVACGAPSTAKMLVEVI